MQRLKNWQLFAVCVLTWGTTFASFLTLQDRLGPRPTGSIGVMTPLLALLVSTAFEGFHPDTLTFAGAALAAQGNVLMLRPVRAHTP